MPNKKISQLVNKTTILSTDLFPIGDATSGQLYKKTIAELQAAIGGAVISVNGLVGTVVLDTDDIQELVSPTNKWFTDARARGAVSATSPLAYNSSTGVFSIPAATTSANGYLTSTDWNTFNGKENVLTFSSPLVRTSNTISMPAATTSVNGYLTSTDWNTFNNKQGALTLTTTGSSGSATLASNTLNIPTYTLAGLGGITASFLSGGTGITYNSGTGVIATTITQYTDALARASLSFTAGSGAYNSTTGVITIPTNTSQLTNGANFITLGSLSGGTGITYNSTTGAISYSGTVYTDSSIRGLFSGSTGISYNSTTGAISSTITQYTDALARASISAGTGISYNSTTGVITNTITQYTDSLARGAISLMTSGSSGASTYNSTTGVLNIPNYGSALSGYLPLTGGTLTGALYGTNARFSGFDSSYYYENILAIGNSTYNPKIGLASVSGYRWNIRIKDVSGDGQFVIRYEEGSLDALSINRSGAATFSSSVTASGSVTINATTDYYGELIYRENGTLKWNAYNDYATDNYVLGNSGGSRLYLTQPGNLGLGVTPSAWGSGFTALQVKGAAIWSTGSDASLTTNAYYDGTSYKYINSSGASRVYNNTDGSIIWSVAPSGTAGNAITFTQAMTLTNGGNLLLGTSTDSGYKLDINGTGRFNSQLSITGSTNEQLIVDYTTTTGAFSWQSFKISGVNKYRFAGNVDNSFGIYSDILTGYPLKIASTGAATFSSNVTLSASNGTLDVGGEAFIRGNGSAYKTHEFTTGASNVAIYQQRNASGTIINKIDANGNIYFNGGSVGIGTSSPGASLDVSGNASLVSNFNYSSNGTYVRWQNNGTSFGDIGSGSSLISGGSVNDFTIHARSTYNIVFATNFSDRGRITNGGNWLLGTSTDNGERLYISGNVRATGTITANSDIRLKKNLERIENALEKVGQISGYTYDTIYDDKRHGGVIAQEIDEVFPEIVNKGNDGLLGVEYGNISALLIEALKELKEKNTALEARLQALEK